MKRGLTLFCAVALVACAHRVGIAAKRATDDSKNDAPTLGAFVKKLGLKVRFYKSNVDGTIAYAASLEHPSKGLMLKRDSSPGTFDTPSGGESKTKALALDDLASRMRRFDTLVIAPWEDARDQTRVSYKIPSFSRPPIGLRGFAKKYGLTIAVSQREDGLYYATLGHPQQLINVSEPLKRSPPIGPEKGQPSKKAALDKLARYLRGLGHIATGETNSSDRRISSTWSEKSTAEILAPEAN
jgi:hypothetical protein